MTSPDLKRLISAFLAFSVITSVGTLISLNFAGKVPSTQESLQVEGSNPLSTISKNAFVEKLPENGQQSAPSTSLGASNAYREIDVSDSSNLTKNFASVFASQMIENNPDGPQLDQDGNPTTLNLPGEKTAEEMIKQALSKTTFSFDERVDIPKDKIAKSFGPDDVSNYLTQTQKILSDVSLAVQTATNQSSTPEDLINHALTIEAAFEKLSSLSVPQPLAEFHKELLGFFANQKNVFYAVTNYQSDPLKTIVAIQNENGIIARDIERVRNAGTKVDQRALSLNNNSEWEKLYSEILGVKKAYAQGLPVFDTSVFTNGLLQLGEFISENLAEVAKWTYTTALRIAVNLLINEFQNEVLDWIAGKGKPKFITDWNGFLSDVANKATGEVIYGIMPQLCTGLGPLLRVKLLPVPYAYTGVRCTLNQVINNVNAFFNSFRTGGWYAYSYAMQPQNNYFGAYILAHDMVTEITAKKTAAASDQAQADKGFLSVTRCTNQINVPAIERADYPDWTVISQSTDPNTGEVTFSLCAPGAQQVTTPGNVVGETLRQSLGWKANQIVTAQRFEELVAAIVNASINRIVKEGLSAITESSRPPTPSFTNATPANVPNPGSITNIVNSLDRVGVFQKNQTIIDADTQWLSLALATTSTTSTTPSVTATSSAITLLNQYAAACGGISLQASERIGDLNTLASNTRAELNSAINLKNLRSTALTATSPQDITNISNQLRGVNIVQITNAATAAQNRLASLQYFITFMQDTVRGALSENNCSVTLISVTSTPPTAP